MFCLALLLAGCVMPGDVAPVVKIGLIAPFEGLGRPLGYAVLPGVQEAIEQANAAGRFGRYRVLLVALNDDLHAPIAAAQARALTQDADIVAVLGPWTADTAAGALPILIDAGIPVLVGAPGANSEEQIRSLCPSIGDIRLMIAEKVRGLGGSGVLLPAGGARPADPLATFGYEGDAASGADDLLRWREAGWGGALVGGPDLFRPWLIDRAGGAADGVIAGVCTPPGIPEDVLSPELHARQLARAGINLLLDALAADVARGAPTRQGIESALSEKANDAGLTWFQVENGEWVVLE